MESIGDGDLKHRMLLGNIRDLVWRDPSILPIEKVLLLDLLFYAGTDNNAFPSHKTLAKNHGISLRYVRRMLKGLKDLGLIGWQKSGFSKSNVYGFTTDIYIPVTNRAVEEQSSMRHYSASLTGVNVPPESGNPVPPTNSQITNSQINQKSTVSLKESQRRIIKNNAASPDNPIAESSNDLKISRNAYSCKYGCEGGWIYDRQLNTAKLCSCDLGRRQGQT